MSARGRFMVAVCAATAATAALTGCNSDDSGGSSAPLVVPAATTSAASADTAKDAPFSSMTAEGIVSLAEADMRAAGAMTVTLNAVESGETQQLKAALTASGKCAATMRINGMNIQLVKTGTAHVYLKGDAVFWRTAGGAKGGKLATAVGDRWVKLDKKARESGGLTEFCSFDGLLTGMLSDDDEEDSDSTVVKGAPTTLDGKQVLPLIEKLPDETDTMYVSTGETPYIVKIEGKGGDSPGYATFSDFGKTPHISAPPASETVDMSDLGIDPGGISI